MRKFFLIPLMTMLCTVMAFATVRTAGNFEQLQDALSKAEDGDEIQLTADIAGFANTANYSALNITKSITIDGQGHTLDGYGKRDATSNHVTLAINAKVNGVAPTHDVEVVIKNINIINRYAGGASCARPLETRGHLTSLTLENVTVTATNNYNEQGLTIGGAQATAANITMTNTKILMGTASYPLITFNPINVTMTDSKMVGYCCMYFKTDTYGGNNSTVIATNCDFDAPNPHSYAGGSNSFGLFVMMAGINGVNITLNNCGMNAEVTGSSAQGMFVSQGNNNLTITGDNSHINGEFVISNKYKSTWLAYAAGHITITGGTYAQDPSNIGTVQCYTFDEYDNIVLDGDNNPVLVPCEVNCVPDGYEVQEVKQGDITLYRVVKKVAEKTSDPSGETLYNLNELVVGEGESAGVNPISSFAVVDSIELEQTVTKAGYVSVGDTATTGTKDSVTVTIPAQKTFVINNGLDVKDNAKVVAEPQSTLIIGEGGIITDNAESIVIEANENGAASLLLDPTITVNQTPNLTVRMTAKQIGKKDGDYYWHRFAMPVNAGITSWEKEGALAPAVAKNYPTYLYGWDYANNEWLKLTNGVADMVPLQGYTLTLASDEMPGVTGLQDVTYIFKGNLVGNTDKALNFQAEGFNFFGNSYTGYMDVLTLIQGIESNNVEGTVYMWCNDPDDDEGRYQSYEGVSLLSLQDPTLRLFLADWQKEVAPMQTFILRLRGADSADESVNYASTIWGNPRYGNGGSAPAPRRAAAANNIENHMAIVVKAANSNGSRVEFTQDAVHSDAFESGYDVVKYMNENAINLYATVDGEDLSTVVSDNIEGKTLSLKTNDEIAYTMSFKNVIGEEYAIRDNATNRVIKIEEGATYDFAAQPNSTIEGRFEIVGVHKVTTAIENADVKANVKGIYTIMGQYLGENFDILPAGVYVVDGVKIVK